VVGLALARLMVFSVVGVFGIKGVCMTVQQVIGLALRLVALYLASSALGSVANGLSMMDDPRGDSAVYFIAAVMKLLLAAYLWFFPMSVAHRLLPKTSGTEKIITNSNQIAVAGVALLGLYEAVQGVLLVFQDVVSALSTSSTSAGSIYERMSADGGGAGFYMDCLQLLIGVVLLLNARKVARFMTMR
jgi:hypothetical protein